MSYKGVTPLDRKISTHTIDRFRSIQWVDLFLKNSSCLDFNQKYPPEKTVFLYSEMHHAPSFFRYFDGFRA